jgi:predicted ATPase
MLQAVSFENFRCLRKVSLRLAPLTVLVGPNASGKSTVLEGLVVDRTLTARDAWWQDGQLPIRREFSFADNRVVRNESVEPRNTHWGAGTGTGVGYTYKRLHLDLARLRRPNQLQAEVSLCESGENLTNVFASLTRKEQIALAQNLCRMVPVFSDVEARPFQAGHHHLLFQDAFCHDVWYKASEVSDGTMLMLAFLLLQYQPSSPDLLAIEEPERGLHPYLLGKLVSFLRDLAHGHIGPRPIQILLATHSAELLEHLRPEEVRFLSRSTEDGSVIVEEAPTTSPEWEQAAISATGGTTLMKWATTCLPSTSAQWVPPRVSWQAVVTPARC